jgi:hypothetical protein
VHPSATVDPLAVAQASAENRRLAQYLVPCPSCGHAAAAHVDESAFEPVLVRLVCPTSCVVDPAAVLALFPSTQHRMSA